MNLDKFIKSGDEIWYVRASAKEDSSSYTRSLSANVIAETVEDAIKKLNDKYSEKYQNIKINSVSHKGKVDIW